MDDLADFYCAGAALNQGESPYTYEPLRSCEHRVNVGTGFRAQLFAGNPSVAVPAPQPPYDFPPFRALARLPFSAARIIDAAAILACVALTAAALATLGIPLALAAAALVLSSAYASLNTGQIVPFALLALAICGVALSRGRDAPAGVLAVLVGVEPAAGLPVIAAMLLFVPRSRIAVVATGLALLLLSIATVGLRGVASYLSAVLPAHAASELHFPFQYSLSYALAHFGASDRAALAAGGISYVVLLAIGLILAPRAAAALQRRELLAYLPALCALIGGTFLHQEELCFALPALLVLTTRASGAYRVLGAFALCILAIPWILVWAAKQLFLASLAVCFVILDQLGIGLRRGLIVFCAVAAALYLFELHAPHLPAPTTAPRLYAPSELIQGEWRDYTRARSTSDPLWFAIKLPAWIALLAALVMAAQAEIQSPLASEASLESLRAGRHPPPA